jgi:class 3 adenylate cyclase
MATYSRLEAAERAGISSEMLTRILELGAVELPVGETFSESDVRKIALIRDFVDGGLPLEGLATQIRTGRMTLSFLESPSSDLFAAMSTITFEQLSATTGIAVHTLMVIREATGSSIPDPSDFVRENEMALVPYVQAQLASGYPSDAVERGLRTMGDALRRFATSEVERFEAFIIAPVVRKPGSTGADISAAASSAIEGMSGTRLKAVAAAFRGQQAAAFSAGIMGGFARDLEAAGLLDSVDRPPAICFLDVTGYTRHTAERGDQAAADLAHELSRLVQLSALKYGGRPVKWLGDGVMLWFRDPGPAVIAALEMAKGVTDAGLPPAHVGLHAGPVVMQDGDYYGQTVNLSSRIAGYARAGEVVVSQAVVDAAVQTPVDFQSLGDVELKGLTEPVRLYAAKLSG